MKTDIANNLPFNLIRRHRRRKKIITDNTKNLPEPVSVRRKMINNSPINEIQTRSKNFKLNDECDLPFSVVQAKSKKIIRGRKNKNLPKPVSVRRKTNNSSINEIQTRSKKFKSDDACNLPFNIVQAKSKKIVTENVKNLLKQKSIKSQMTISFQYLPELVLESIFEHLSFHEIAILRIMCRRFNEICKRLLNKGHRVIIHQNMESVQKAEDLSMFVKGPLYDIDTIISMLDLTFYYHINENRCCFFPGKVLDLIRDIFLIEDKVKTKSFTRRATQSEVCAYLTPERLKKIKNVSDKALKHAVENIFPAFNISMESTRVILLSSTPMLLNELVLRSVLGKLKSTDIDEHYTMANLAFVNLFQRIPMRDHLKMFKIKYDTPIQRLDRYHIPEKVLGSFGFKEKTKYLVKWKGRNEAGFVHLIELGEKFSDILLEYMDNSLETRQYSIGNQFFEVTL